MPYRFDGTMTISARHAWLSVDSMQSVRKIYSQEEQTKINKCLSCQYDECVNCLDKHYKHESKRGKNTVDLEQLQYLLSLKRTIPEICEEMNISRRTYYNKKKLLGGK